MGWERPPPFTRSGRPDKGLTWVNTGAEIHPPIRREVAVVPQEREERCAFGLGRSAWVTRPSLASGTEGGLLGFSARRAARRGRDGEEALLSYSAPSALAALLTLLTLPSLAAWAMSVRYWAPSRSMRSTAS